MEPRQSRQVSPDFTPALQKTTHGLTSWKPFDVTDFFCCSWEKYQTSDPSEKL